MEYFPLDKILQLAYAQITHSVAIEAVLGVLVSILVLLCLIQLFVFFISFNQSFFFVTMQLPVTNKEDSEEAVAHMTSIFATIHGTIHSWLDKVSIEIIKADEYITIQLGSNKKSILQENKRLFSQLHNVTFTEGGNDLLHIVSSSKARSLYTSQNFLPIGTNEFFYDGVISYLSSLSDQKQAGIQIILRGVNKRFSIERKIISLENRMKKENKLRLTETEKLLIEEYNRKLSENLFRAKINIFTTDSADLTSIKSLFQSLNSNKNNWYSYPILALFRFTILKRLLFPESLFDVIPPLRELNGSYLTSSELATLIHPSSIVASRYLPESTNSIDATPDFLEKRDTNIQIGTIQSLHGEKPIYFPMKSFQRHWYIVGKTGRGKSTLMEDVALAIREQIEVKKVGNTFFIDPHGDSILKFITEVKSTRNLVYLPLNVQEERIYTINPLFCFGKNEYEKAARRDALLEIIKSETKDETGNNFMGTPTLSFIKNAIDIGIEFADAYYNFLINVKKMSVENAEKRVGEKQLTLNDLPLVFLKEMGYVDLIQEVFENSDTSIGLYIRRSMDNDVNQVTIAKAAKYRLEQLLHPSIILVCEGNKLSLQDAISSHNTYLIPLPESIYGSRGQRLLLKSMLSMLWEYKTGIAQKDRIDSYILVDELQRAQISTLTTMFSEARKYKEYLVVANQQMGQLTPDIRDAIIGNVGTITCFTVGPKELGAGVIAEIFGNEVTEQNLLNLPAFSAYLQTENEHNKAIARFTFQTTKPE